MFAAFVSQQDLLRFNLTLGILNQYFLSMKTILVTIIFCHVALKFCCPWESTRIKTLAFVLMEIILLKGNLLENFKKKINTNQKIHNFLLYPMKYWIWVWFKAVS